MMSPIIRTLCLSLLLASQAVAGSAVIYTASFADQENPFKVNKKGIADPSSTEVSSKNMPRGFDGTVGVFEIGATDGKKSVVPYNLKEDAVVPVQGGSTIELSMTVGLPEKLEGKVMVRAMLALDTGEVWFPGAEPILSKAHVSFTPLAMKMKVPSNATLLKSIRFVFIQANANEQTPVQTVYVSELKLTESK